tara:strand:- start:267 stop:1754 length:1488 start_codon:yes stop_codon:yes gene_type:complete
MWDEHEATDSLYWKSNRKSDIAFLLGGRLDITVSDPSSSVNQRVGELDFTNLTEFQDKLGLDVGAITTNNYNLSYIWLTSRNAPSWESITKLDGTPANLISSTKQFIEDSRLRLQRLLESKIYAEDEIPSFELEVTSLDSDGMSLEIALPYTTNNSDNLRCDVPGYDRDATELLLMALVNDKLVRNISQIRLRDSNLANKGLCTLVGERRGSTPSFEEDYQGATWASESLCPDRIFVHIPLDELSDNGFGLGHAPTTTTDAKLDAATDAVDPNKATEHEIAFGKAWIRTDTNDNKHDDYLSMSSASSPTYDGTSSGCLLIGIRNWLSDRPFPNGRDVYGDTIVLLKFDGSTTKEVYTYPTALRPGISRVYTDLRGDAIVAPGLLSFNVNTTNPEITQYGDFTIQWDKEKTGSPSIDSNGGFILSENLDLGIEIRPYDLAAGERVKRHANRSFLLSTTHYNELINELSGLSSPVEFVLLDESTLYPASGSDALGGV